MPYENLSRWPKALWVQVALGVLSAMMVLIMSYSWVRGAERKAILHVEYAAPTLSVEAHHVFLQEVLVAVGGQVGFQVVMIGKINSPVIYLSAHKASVEDVLDTLLGGRNYGVSYHTASGQAGHGIDKVFVIGTPESEGGVTSRVVTMGEHYPISTQDSPSSLKELRTRHQEIFNQLRENEGLNEHYENNQQEPSQGETTLLRQQQQEVEKARSLFDTLRQANQMQRVNGKTTSPSQFTRSTSALDHDLESFHDVLMEMTKQ